MDNLDLFALRVFTLCFDCKVCRLEMTKILFILSSAILGFEPMIELKQVYICHNQTWLVPFG